MLRFWSFDDEQDGNELKIEFKRRFAVAEKALSEDERKEVVDEAVWIMDTMVEVVGEMADMLGKDLGSEDAKSRPAVASAPGAIDGRKGGTELAEESMRWLLLKHILPMGLVELLISGAGLLVSKRDDVFARKKAS